MAIFAGSLDTNVILRLVLNDIPDQHQKAKVLLISSKQQFAVADVAIIEVGFALERYYRFTRQQIREVLRDFMGLRQVNCNRILFDNALDVFEQNSSLSLEDCTLATYAELNQAKPLYTFDKKLANKSANAQLIN